MSYFVVWDGSIQEAFDGREQAASLAAQHPGATVIGDEWLTLGTAKDRIAQARFALDEIAPLIGEDEASRMRQPLDVFDAMIEDAWERLGLAPG